MTPLSREGAPLSSRACFKILRNFTPQDDKGVYYRSTSPSLIHPINPHAFAAELSRSDIFPIYRPKGLEESIRLCYNKLMKKLKGPLLLLLAAFIWGCAFVAQKVGMDYVEPYTFNAVRTILGGLALLVFILIRDGARHKPLWPFFDKPTLVGGVLCGLILAVATNLQQVGMQYTTAGKGGFITATYVVLVPLLSIVLRKRTTLKTWFAAAAALLGLYLLCVNPQEGFSVNRGDLLILVCAFAFAIHIMVIDHFIPKVDGVKMACMQFFVCGFLTLIPVFALESPDVHEIFTAWLPIVYAGVFSCAVAYTLQIVGQKGMNPSLAALILCFESVFAVLSGWALRGETMSLREVLGCAVMFLALIAAQVQFPLHKKAHPKEAAELENNDIS